MARLTSNRLSRNLRALISFFRAGTQGAQHDFVQREHAPKACKHSLVALGVKLLELSFGETLGT